MGKEELHPFLIHLVKDRQKESSALSEVEDLLFEKKHIQYYVKTHFLLFPNLDLKYNVLEVVLVCCFFVLLEKKNQAQKNLFFWFCWKLKKKNLLVRFDLT